MKIYNVTLEMSSTPASPKGTFRRTMVAENRSAAIADLCSFMLKEHWVGVADENIVEGEFVNPPVFHVVKVEEIGDAVNGW